MGSGVVKHAANQVFSGKVDFVQDWLNPPTLDRPQFPSLGGRGYTSPSPMVSWTTPPPPSPAPRRPLPTVAQPWGIITWVGAPLRPLPAPVKAQKPLGEISFAKHTKNTDSGQFCFWCGLFFKPTCSLGSAGKQDIPREGRWSHEQDSAAALAGSPRPLLRGGRTRHQAPSWLGRSGQPFCASVPSRGKLPFL